MAQYYHTSEYDDAWEIREYEVDTSTAPSAPSATYRNGEAIVKMETDPDGNHYAVLRDSPELVKYDDTFTEVWRTNIGSGAAYVEGENGGMAVGQDKVFTAGGYSGQMNCAVVDKQTGSVDSTFTDFGYPVTRPIPHPNEDTFFVVGMSSASGAMASFKFDFTGTRISFTEANQTLNNDYNSGVQVRAAPNPNGGGIVGVVTYLSDGAFNAEYGYVVSAWDGSNTHLDDISETTSQTGNNETFEGATFNDGSVAIGTEQRTARFVLDGGTWTRDFSLNTQSYPRGAWEATLDGNLYIGGQQIERIDYSDGSSVWSFSESSNYHLGSTFPEYPTFEDEAWVEGPDTAAASQPTSDATMLSADAVVPITRVNASRFTSGASMLSTTNIFTAPIDATLVASTGTMNTGTISAMTQTATSVSTAATPNQVGPLDEAIGGTQFGAVADSNIGSLSSYNLSALSGSTVASMNDIEAEGTIFAEPDRLAVSASQNDATLTSLTTGATQFGAVALTTDPILDFEGEAKAAQVSVVGDTEKPQTEFTLFLDAAQNQATADTLSPDLSFITFASASDIAARPSPNAAAVRRIALQLLSQSNESDIGQTQNSADIRTTVNEVE